MVDIVTAVRKGEHRGLKGEQDFIFYKPELHGYVVLKIICISFRRKYSLFEIL